MRRKTIVRAVTVGQSLGFHWWVGPAVRQWGFEAVSVSAPGGEAEKLAEEKGFNRVVTIPMERHIAPLRDLRALWQLWRLFRRERPAMVHSMTPKAGLLCMMAAWAAKVPLRVHTFTGLVFPTATGLTRRILMATDRLTCACATHIIPEGEGVRRDLLDNHITRKDIRVLGHGNVNGIDLGHFDPEREDVRAAAEPLRHPGVFTFVFVGRLVGDKGISELIEAFVRLHDELPATRLVMVGRQEPELDPLRPETLSAIAGCEAIEAVGRQSDVRPWLAAADCLAFPSYREGFPNVVIEAGAMGLPSIVTDINGSREIIADGVNGLIIPSHDSDALYRAMRRLATDPTQCRQLAAPARRLIADRYEQSYVRKCLLDFYRQILPDEAPQT